MTLKPLICPNCAGHVDRATLTCNMCGLQFQMDREEHLMVIHYERAKMRTLAGEVMTEPYFLADPDSREHVTKHIIEEMAHKMAIQMLPLIEFQTEYNPDFGAFVTYGRVRIAEPEMSFKPNLETFWESKV